jgi:hypothetical protein
MTIKQFFLKFLLAKKASKQVATVVAHGKLSADIVKSLTDAINTSAEQQAATEALRKQVADLQAALPSPKSIVPPGPICVESGPCPCAQCRATMLTIVSQLAFRDLANAYFAREAQTLPPRTPQMMARRFEKRVCAEVANYRNN